MKHKQFRGQLNVTIRFAHPYGWDAKDPIVKEDIHAGEFDLIIEYCVNSEIKVCVIYMRTVSTLALLTFRAFWKRCDSMVSRNWKMSVEFEN